MTSKAAMKVLILEDNAYDAELNLKTLSKESWLVDHRIATDENSFRVYLQEFNPDIILSDYNLPLFNGLEALNIAKSEKPLTPFIIVTGSLDEETAVDCIKQGAWDYVLKERLIRLNPAVKFAMELRQERQQRALVESSLRISEEHYRALAQNSPDIIMRFDRQGRHIFVNDTVYEQIKIKPELFVNKTHHEMGIFPLEMSDFWAENISKVFKSKLPHEIEFKFPAPDQEIFFEWRLFPEFNDSGEVITVLTVARDISYKKQAQLELAKSREQLQMALEATNDAIWDYNFITKEMYFSPSFLQMLGYEQNEFRNDLGIFDDLVHPDDKQGAFQLFTETENAVKETIELELRLRRKNGTYAWIKARGKVFSHDVDGRPERLVGTNVDITQKKRQEEIQQTFFEIGNTLVTTRNLEEMYQKIREILGRIIDTGNCFISLYDYKSDNISTAFHWQGKKGNNEISSGKSLTSYVIHTGKSQLLDALKIKELYDSGMIDKPEYNCVSWLSVPLRTDNQIIGVFAIQSYDENIIFTLDDMHILEFVSDQIALTISRKKAEDQIRENEQKLRKIIESSPDGLLVTGIDGTIIDHNSWVIEMLLGRSNKIKSRNLLEFVSPVYQPYMKSLFRETMRTGAKKNNELKMIRDEGSEFFAEISLGLIQNYKKSTEAFVINIKDITDRLNYEYNLRIAKEKAEESDKLKTSFLSNMSHEIRTPLNAIVGFAELLSVENLSDGERKEFISHISRGSDTLLSLIDDIIDISKIEAGQISINNSGTNLPQLFNELHDLFLKNLQQKNRGNLTLEIFNNEIDPDFDFVTDSLRLKQVFINLLNNAIKFTESGGISFGLKMKEENLIYFYVKDTGIGIKKDKLSLIFDRFRQGHESKKKFYGGTGLGLSISKNLIELMGGDIKVNSQPGNGSEFIFSVKNISPAKELQKPEKIHTNKKHDWHNKTILVAEDEDSNFMLIDDMLKRTKVNLLWAKDGREAVKIFKDHKEIDLVLMDIRLPHKNGYEATREMKKINGDVPIIAQTAYAMTSEKEQSLNAGCNAYIAKPIKIQELITLISGFLDS